MAQVTVSIEQYRDGLLPHVCVVSGMPTEDVVVVRTVVNNSGGAGGLPGVLEGFMEAVDVRRPRDILLGRLPMSVAARRRLVSSKRYWSAVFVLALLGVGASAWAGAIWSPVGAAVSGVVVSASWWKQRRLRRSFPHSTLTHGGSLVTIDNVNAVFAEAVGRTV